MWYRIYLLVFLMVGLAGIGGARVEEILDRPRPFVEYAGEISVFSNTQTPAFPSGHGTKSVALALPFSLLISPKDNWHRGRPSRAPGPPCDTILVNDQPH